MNKYKVTIGNLFDGIATLEDLRDMYNKGMYTDPESPSPERQMLVDGVVVDKASLEELLSKYTPVLSEYQMLRKYPSIGDQLDSLFHAGIFPEDMRAQIQAVKDKFPKGDI